MEYELRPCIDEKSETSISIDKQSCDDEDDGVRERTSCDWGTWSLVLVLFACGAACVVMLTTNIFGFLVQRNLTLRNNTMRYEVWRRPPVHATLRVYLFNYTNIKEYEAGAAKKLVVREIGPYTYVETLERVNVTHNDNGTLSYRDKKMYKFSPELSRGFESDRVVVPNIPFLGAMAFAKSQSFLTSFSLSMYLRTMDFEPFINLNVSEFLWGYQENLSVLTSLMVRFKYNVPMSEFGILATKNRTQEDVVTIFTGEDNVTATGIISEYNRQSSLTYWKTRECNRIDGTDGTIYPPGIIKPNATLYLYVKDMCRRVPLVYDDEYVDQHGISVYRYSLARDVFDNGKFNPENRCFCGGSDCLPAGVFNVSPCAFGGPIITSLPHFLYGDPTLLDDFETLSPRPEIHESFVEIDPRLGVPLSGKSRFQLNVLLRNSAGVKRIPYKDKLILPVSWMDYGVDRLPEDLSSLVRNLLLVIQMTEMCLSYGFVVATVVSSALIARRVAPRRKRGLFVKNLELSTADVPLMVCHGKT